MNTPSEIFLVEDDRFDAHLMRKKLEKDNPGVNVRTFFNAESFRSKILARKKVPALVILDFHLPDGSGLELVQFLKQMDADVKILIVSGEKAKYLMEECLEGGAQQFIHKNSNTLDRLVEEAKAILGYTEAVAAPPSVVELSRKELRRRRKERQVIPIWVFVVINILISIFVIMFFLNFFT